MPSRVISDSQRQVSLQLEVGLSERHRSLKDAVAAGVYHRGLKRMAAELDLAPGNLSVALGDSGERKFSLDELERYIQVTGDKTPIFYLIDRYLGDEAAARDDALAKVQAMLADLPGMMAAAGINHGRGRK